jgi:nicotinate-nucleotide adenylyltransferase
MGDEAKALGFFGGSFDPPHLGHLILARDAFDQLSLEKIHLVPARQSPLRSGSHAMAFEERLAMCRLLAQGRDWLDVLDIEGALPSPSYTVNTVRRLAEVFPGRKLVWLVGADQWEKLPKWKDWETLATLVSFAVAARPGHKVAKLPRPRPEFTVLKAREVDISSTEIRERLAAGRSIEHLVPREIAEYIDRRRLYGHH